MRAEVYESLLLESLSAATMRDVVPSPDSRLVAFVLSTDRTVEWATKRVDTGDVWVVEIATSDALPVSRTSDVGWIAYGPSWSPDSQRIAFRGMTESRIWSVVVATADGSSRDLILEWNEDFLGAPSWSPAGDRIALGRSLGDFGGQSAEIVTMAPDGSNEEVAYRLESVPKNIGPSACIDNPKWSPDANLISFSSIDRDPRGKTVIVDVAKKDVLSRRVAPTIGWIDDKTYAALERVSDRPAEEWSLVFVDAPSGEVRHEVRLAEHLKGGWLSYDGAYLISRAGRQRAREDSKTAWFVVRCADGEPTGEEIAASSDDDVRWMPDASGFLMANLGYGGAAPRIAVAPRDGGDPTVIVPRGRRPAFSTFTTSDVWLFVSIAWSSPTKPVSLRRVIGTADAIEHAIPLHEEIERGANRLVRAEVIFVDGTMFRLTEKGRALYRGIKTHDSDILRRRVHSALEQIPIDDVPDPGWSLDARVFQQAYDDYHADFQKRLKISESLDSISKPVFNLIRYLTRSRKGD